MATRLTPAEQRIIVRRRTPESVQRWLRGLKYNQELDGPTLRSFRGVARLGTAHCLEAALAAAVILEHHGYPPLLLDLESEDRIDHVVFMFRRSGRLGSVGFSRDSGLYGRRPVFRTLRALAASYFEPYVNDQGARITGYALADLRELAGYDWRFAEHSMWKVERYLIDLPHRPLTSGDRRYSRLQDEYRRFARSHHRLGTPFTRGRRNWM